MSKKTRRFNITQEIRHAVYDKCNGHCAYCGCDLPYERMQVDHVKAISRSGTDDIDNLLPSCRSCNHYKGTMTLERYREYIETLPNRIKRDNVTYQIGLRYGNIIENKKPIKFYFEVEVET